MERKLSKLKDFFKYFINNWKLIISLAKNDFKKRYAGSYLGIVWSFIQPLVTIGVMWFVFSVGFRTTPIEGVPFILWLSAGMIPWFFFSEALSTSTNSLVEYSFMLRQMAFRGSILPIIKLITSFFIHLFFLGILFFIYFYYNGKINMYMLQLVYYIFCMIYLLVGLGWFFSSIRPFLKDISEIIGVVLQLGFWITPIFWNIEIVPERYQVLFKLNPMYYIIQGYRDTFVYKIWFWQRPLETLIFFIITSFIFFLGTYCFKMLRPHFNDVL